LSFRNFSVKALHPITHNLQGDAAEPDPYHCIVAPKGAKQLPHLLIAPAIANLL
jgi:hypothetical protein